MAGVLLALREARRAKARFSLLAAAVGILVFLIVFQQALLGALVDQFVGGIERQSAQVLVYGEDARRNLQGSVVPAEAADAVAAVEGVEAASPFGVATFSARPGGAEELTDAVLLGYELGGPGAPTSLEEGRLPDADGEVVASPASDAEGFELGTTVLLEPGGTEVTIVGLADGAQLSVTTSLFGSYATWEDARRAANPEAPAVLPSAVAVAVADGEEPAAVAERITASVPGVEALDRERAADEAPGVDSVNQSLQLILTLTFVVVGLVVGFFFLILTVQKRSSLTLLRALGAPSKRLVGALLTQVALVVGGGFVLGVALAGLLLATAGILGASLSPGPVATVAVVIAVFSIIASTGAVRRVLRIDPVEATVPGGAR